MATGLHKVTRNGFTLIEILVVVVIIGIVVMATGFLLKDSGQGQTVRASVNALQQRLLFAEQQAVLTNSPIGFAISQKGYQFYQLNINFQGNAQWQLLTNPRALGYQVWSGKVDLQLNLGDKSIVIEQKLPAQPMIIINPSATITPFKLQIDQYTLEGELNGVVKIAQ